MTVHAMPNAAERAVPVPVAGAWETRVHNLGPCRVLAGEVVAMVYPTPHGRWAWVANYLGRVTSEGTEQATEHDSREGADRFLRRNGLRLN